MFLNVVLLLVYFLVHPLVYTHEMDIALVGLKFVAVACIDIFYMYIFVFFAYVLRIYNRVGSLYIEHLKLLDSFDEGLIVKMDPF